MIFDTEVLISTLKEIIKTNINNKITEIQAEKDALLGSDNFNVPLIDDNAWFNSLNEECSNYDPFIYYGIAKQEPIEEYGATANNVVLFFTVVLNYDNIEQEMYLRMLRYIRALTEVVQENFSNKISATSKLEITSLNPMDLRDMETNELSKIGGIEISTAIA